MLRARVYLPSMAPGGTVNDFGPLSKVSAGASEPLPVVVYLCDSAETAAIHTTDADRRMTFYNQVVVVEFQPDPGGVRHALDLPLAA
jgi:hypothetical protein